MNGRPLSGVLYLVIAVGLAVAWSRGYLNPVTEQVSKLLAGPVPKRPFVVTPITAFGDTAARSNVN